MVLATCELTATSVACLITPDSRSRQPRVTQRAAAELPYAPEGEAALEAAMRETSDERDAWEVHTAQLLVGIIALESVDIGYPRLRPTPCRESIGRHVTHVFGLS